MTSFIDRLLGRLSARSNSQPITASVPHLGDFPFRVHVKTDQYISGDLLRTRIWEPFETEVFRRLCRRGDFVLDIGANIGWYSVIASRLVGKAGTLWAIEPDHLNFELLRYNLKRSGGSARQQMFLTAIGEQDGKQDFYLSESNLGDHHLFDDGEARRSVQVTVRSLDSLLAQAEQLPTLVKSDTQGSEYKILRGAARLLAAGWRPVLLLEFWPYGLSKSGDDPTALQNRLQELGYDLFEVTEAHTRLIPYRTDRLQERLNGDLAIVTQGFINLLCLPAGSDRESQLADLLEKRDF